MTRARPAGAFACSTATSPPGTRAGRTEPLQVDFYHLTATPLNRALPRIAERIVAGGGRALVVSANEEQRRSLDKLLWTYAADSFLPHGMAGGEGEGEQLLLIAEAPAPVANGARFVILADGTWRDEALGFERAFHFFDDEAVVAARAAWRALATHDGVERRYWRQDEGGRWEQAG